MHARIIYMHVRLKYIINLIVIEVKLWNWYMSNNIYMSLWYNKLSLWASYHSFSTYELRAYDLVLRLYIVLVNGLHIWMIWSYILQVSNFMLCIGILCINVSTLSNSTHPKLYFLFLGDDDSSDEERGEWCWLRWS